MGGKFSKNKPESSSSSSTNFMNTMNPGSARIAASGLSLKEISKLARTSKSNRQIFHPLLNEVKGVRPVLKAVVQGNVEELKKLIADNPVLLFKKGEVTDPNGLLIN